MGKLFKKMVAIILPVFHEPGAALLLTSRWCQEPWAEDPSCGHPGLSILPRHISNGI